LSTSVTNALAGKSAEGRVQLAQIQKEARSIKIWRSSGKVDAPFHLMITTKSSEFEWRTLVLKKAPTTHTFAPGVRVDDAYYISYVDVNNITITVSKDAAPELMLSAVFLNDDRVKETHNLKIVVSGAEVTVFETDEKGVESAAPVATPPFKTNSAAPPASGASLMDSAPAAKLPPLDAALESSYLQRAQKLLTLGQIAPARLLLEHLANKGSARGAMLLAQTYDKNYLQSLNVVGGVSGDRDKALRWYRKAQELGAAEAAALIQRLN
jgi:hypothetical protein